MSNGEKNGRNWFLVGIVIGAVLGGSAGALSFKWFIPKPTSADSYEFLKLSHEAAFDALRVNKRTGESWGLTTDGTWRTISTNWGIQDPDEWLKQHYAPDSNGNWVEKTN